MISAKKGIFHIKNRETGEFESIVAVKGDKGDGADIVAMDKYFTTETGDSEELVMTQKGVTDLHSDIVNGETKVGVATLAEKANEADLAEHATTATGDAKGNTIDKTYAKLTQVNGTVLSTNILEEAVRLVGNGDTCKVEHRYINISDAEWLKGDFDIPEGLTRYGYVTFFIRYGSVTVWLWGAVGSNAYYNSYTTSTGKWIGWRKVIDSKNIGEQSVNHAKTADSAKTADRAVKVTAERSTANSDNHLVYFTGNNNASVINYDLLFKYNPSTSTLTVPNIKGTATKATNADHADHADHADKADKADNATQDANGKVIDKTYATKDEVVKVAVYQYQLTYTDTVYTVGDAPSGKTTEDIVAISCNGEFAQVSGMNTHNYSVDSNGISNNHIDCSGTFIISGKLGIEHVELYARVEDGKLKLGVRGNINNATHCMARYLDGTTPTGGKSFTNNKKYFYVHFK